MKQDASEEEDGDAIALRRKQIADCLRSEEFRRLKEYYEKETVFDILGVDRSENHHSRFLGWLLDPSGTHRLETLPLLKFLHAVALAKKEIVPRNAASLFSDDLLDAFVMESCRIINADIRREVVIPDPGRNSSNRRLDLLVEVGFVPPNSEEVLLLPVIVENKVDSGEHDGQTPAYRDWAMGHYGPDHGTHEPLFVYLTADSTVELRNDTAPRCDCPDYVHVNYQYLDDRVLAPCLGQAKTAATKALLEDYIRCLSFSKIDLDDADSTGNNENGRTVMAISEQERTLLTQFWNNNRTLLVAALSALADNPDSDMNEEERETVRKAVNIGIRDTTKYSLDGEGRFSKRSLVRKVVLKWISQNPEATFDAVDNAFPGALLEQAAWNVVVRADQVDPERRERDFFPPERLRDGTDLLILKQWGRGRGFDAFLARARELGFRIETVS